MAEITLFIGLTGLMYMLGFQMGVYDAHRISQINTTRSLNHKSRLFIRMLASLLGAAGLWLLLGHPGLSLLASLWLYSLSVLHLAFVPALNQTRQPPKPRFYVSPSNNYDRLFIRLFGNKAGQVAYFVQVVVLVVALVWVIAVY